MSRLTKKTALLLLAGVLTLPTISLAQNAEATAPQASLLAGDAASQAFSNVERRALTADVAEYTFQVRVGSGPYDVIGVHRVVKETAPNVPARTKEAVFLAHGDIWNFRAAFLTAAQSDALPDDQALPVFLAENGVDVWGIDFRWTHVPRSETDFTFMADWGIEQDARDLGVAIGVARVTRALTGSGFGKVTLLGWSRGGQIGYAYLNGETQLPPGLRQVDGYIPVDIYLKTDDAGLKARACLRQQGAEAELDKQNYASAVGTLAIDLGTAAIADPDGPSLALGGFTNRQAGLVVGAATFFLLQGTEPAPAYHFTGGTFEGIVPNGLLYSTERALFDFETAASPYQPNRELADADAAVCEATDVPFDDHLSEITVPVLYVGAGGGFGEYGIYTTTLLGSTDVTSLVVNLLPVEARIADYGHADLFLANDAETRVWQPILDWIRAH
jgi:hypothetical protein